MKLTRFLILVILLNFLIFPSITSAQNSIIKSGLETIQLPDIENSPPIAINDTFFLFTGCDRISISGDIFLNDSDPDGDEIELFYIITPKVGELSINTNGQFSFTIPTGYLGTLIFEYYIKEVGKNNYVDLAEVVIFVKPDHDCDNISDEDDIDDDNDGILDIHEDNGKIDSDMDGIPNSFDIDSDNDGITDNVEWQHEDSYVHPAEKDINFNGWDDAYDNSSSIGGIYYDAEDCDKNGEPDYTDTDSDNDGISDFIEAGDQSSENISEGYLLNRDFDQDGLDDVFDFISCWTEGCNSIGSNSPLPDVNKNGIRDWRDQDNSIPGEENFATVDHILIYPNPSKEAFSVFVPNSVEQERIELLLYSANGNLVTKKIISSFENTVNVTNYNSGVYTIKLRFDTFIHSEQLIIIH